MLISHKALLRLVIVAAGIYVASEVTAIYLPLILAIVLSFILNPLVSLFSHVRLWPLKRYLPRGAAIILAYISASVIVMVCVAFILLPFMNEFNKFIHNLPALYLKFQNLSYIVQKRAYSQELPENVRVYLDEAVSRMASYSLEVTRRILNSIFQFASQIVELVVVPVLAYYFLKDWQQLKDSVVRLFPATMQTKASQAILEMGRVISAYIRGQILISAVVGVLAFGGMLVLDVDYPLVLGLLAALTETIPIIGPIIGALPAVMLAYLSSPGLAIKVVLFYTVVQQVENHIIVPKIMGRTIDLHPVIVIISLLVGGQLLGIAGMMLAVPVAALIRVLVKYVWYNAES